MQLFGNEEPTPEQLLRMPEQLFVGVGLSKRKTGTAQRAAALFLDQGLSAEKLEQMTDDAISATLTSVTGIGTWTAQGFLVLALDRPDAFPAGDLAIRRAVQHLDRLDALPTEANVLQRAERWRPNRALAAGYLIAFDSKQEKDGSVGSGRTTPR